MKPILIIMSLAFLQGCTAWDYKIKNDTAVFEVRSWNHNPLKYPVKDADIPTFREHKKGYAKDRNRVYYKGSVIEHADPDSFVILENGYAKDNYRVFLLRCIVQSADAKSFSIIQGNWAKDQNSVFYADRRIPDADPSKIRVVGDCWAIDSQNAYQHIRGFQIGCDDENRTLQVTVFHGIDADSFEVLDCFRARDNRAGYDVLGNPKKAVKATRSAHP